MNPNRATLSEKPARSPLAAGLSEHFSFLEKISNDCRDGLIIADREGQIILFSKIAESLFGYAATEILGENIKVLMPEHYRADHDRYVSDYRTTGSGKILGIGPRDLPAMHKNGFAVPIQLSISTVSSNGEAFSIALCRDTYARIENETALREAHDELVSNYDRLKKINGELEAARSEANSANAAKSDFLAMMSHELRTPLNGIMGMAQVLESTGLNHDQRQYLKVIADSSETLLILLNDVLDIAKAESGRLSLELCPNELLPFVDNVAEHWRLRCLHKGISFELTIANALPKYAQFDPVRVKQILDNLLSNAVKFTDTGKVTFLVRFLELGPQARLCFEVVDTGIGIAPEFHDKLFEGFTQADSSITRRFGGTGLGLAICRKLVAQMGGEIGFQSTIGSGTRFTIAIPYQAVEHAPPPPAIKSADVIAENPESGRQMDILVAEDNKLNQELISAILRALKYEFTIVENGSEAIKALDEKHFDLVLMDLHMPEMDGLAATRAIRARNDDLSSIPIIGLTASAMGKDREDCLDAGMSAYVTKPYNVGALGKLIASFALDGKN